MRSSRSRRRTPATTTTVNHVIIQAFTNREMKSAEQETKSSPGKVRDNVPVIRLYLYHHHANTI
jgi:hypothetical protein